MEMKKETGTGNEMKDCDRRGGGGGEDRGGQRGHWPRGVEQMSSVCVRQE